MLLDSNIIIYSAIPANESLRDFIAENSPFVSDISLIEVLGYHELTNQIKEFFAAFFDSTAVIPMTEDVLVKAIRLRQSKKMSLGDPIIAATAITNQLTLLTNNTRDFGWIENLAILNPLEKS
ncbi:MAG: type II toxin-antitoxin system VapC family toxin [Blastocatellia bacterium]